MDKCPCGENYNEEGTCPKCDSEFLSVVDELMAAQAQKPGGG